MWGECVWVRVYVEESMHVCVCVGEGVGVL